VAYIAATEVGQVQEIATSYPSGSSLRDQTPLGANGRLPKLSIQGVRYHCVAYIQQCLKAAIKLSDIQGNTGTHRKGNFLET
jgi:hypothetical protein